MNPLEYKNKAQKLLWVNTITDFTGLMTGANLRKILDLIQNPPYKSFKIPKRKGGIREIFAPEKSLKEVQRDLNVYLQAYYQQIKPDCVYGFTLKPTENEPFCNIVKNAEPHIRKRFVLNIDIKDFFPSIPAKSVLELFRSHLFNFNEQTAIVCALLLTYKGRLPAGAPTSPVISNFICLSMDSELLQYSQNNQLTYTRYADDLTFSADYPIRREQITAIIAIIGKSGFSINKKKFRIVSSYTQQKVTGIIVNQKINIDRRQIKKVRAMLHDCQTNGVATAAAKHFGMAQADERLQNKFLNHLNGHIRFIGQVRGKNDPIYRKFLAEKNMA
ncbi:MAG: reverse transcriptase family protein [Dysgonamonadaceae bacterium]|jgi:RNA-directed DNA polymerase|nr:reverse transcriptase family protein [Dysgonamonadaceae bacterium]